MAGLKSEKPKKLTKEQKKLFADSFLICQDGMKALKAAGLEESIPMMQYVVLDEEIGEYVDRYKETVDLIQGRTKAGHTAKLEKLFKIATGEEEQETVTYDENGKAIVFKTRAIHFAAAGSLSDRIVKLREWDKVGDNVKIEVDLQIDDNLYKPDDEDLEEQEQERDTKVENHLKAEGLL